MGSITPAADKNVMQFQAQCLVQGTASGELLFSHKSLSFWGGVDPTNGNIVDHHHPLRGNTLKNRVFAIPSGRGSCTGSGLLLELLLSGNGPTGLIFQEREHILTLGVLVAKAVFDLSVPVVVLSPENFAAVQGWNFVQIDGDTVSVSDEPINSPLNTLQRDLIPKTVELSDKDEEMLSGAHGHAARIAMEILLKMADIQGADRLIDITQAHIDCCIYIGPACLRFAQRLADMGARVVVPTTLNSISVDYRRWKEMGIAEDVGQPAGDLANAYLSMGAKMSFTCAPYLLESSPGLGEQIGWAESNAVVFANSILGARTQKYPDFLDVCIALTGRAPLSGCHKDEDRLPRLVVTLPKFTGFDDLMYPLTGYVVGEQAGPYIPLVCGLEHVTPRVPDLKAFGAAFATTSSAPMFHIQGVTPESHQAEDLVSSLRHISITYEDLITAYRQLNTAMDLSVGLISLGNPHFSIEEFADLARLCSGRQKHAKSTMVVTTNRAVQAKAEKAGYLEILYNFGADTITDTCWCMIDEPVVPLHARNVMTNSGKYAHYAPALVKRGVHFGSLLQCVEAACSAEFHLSLPQWLSNAQQRN